MAQYESNFKSLGVYVNGRVLTFNNGQYSTEDKHEIAVLDTLRDVKRVDEPKPEAKPAAKAPAKRTASGK